MQFIITKQDIEDNPILQHRGFSPGDSCDTTWFHEPTLRLNPPAQDRANTPEVEVVNIPATVEETIGEPEAPITTKAPEVKAKPEPKKKSNAKKQ